MDNEFAYSTPAENVLAEFFEVDSILYVEGQDDILFWRCVFDELSTLAVEIIPLGTCLAVDRKIEAIASGNLVALAARDADYLRVTGAITEAPRVMYTYGYSIENTLYSPEMIAEIIKIKCRPQRITPQIIADAQSWHSDFCISARDLIRHDLARHLENSGHKIYPSHCKALLKKIGPKTSDDSLCSEAVAKHLDTSGANDLAARIADADNTLSNHPDWEQRYIKGHFLQEATSCHLRKKMRAHHRKDNFPDDDLIELATSELKKLLHKNLPQANYYRNQVLRLASSLQAS